MLASLEAVQATLDDKIRHGGMKLLSGSRHTVNEESLPEPSPPKKKKEVPLPSLDLSAADKSPHFTALETEVDVEGIGSEVGFVEAIFYSQ
jgi:hypothetical protein